jgi:hypothetical protein
METRRHFSTFRIAGFTYWEGCIALTQLKIGTELRLEREADNKFDPYAVAVYFNEYKLGYIPRDENREISKFLDMGYKAIFEVRINRIDKRETPENQVGAIVYLVKNQLG